MRDPRGFALKFYTEQGNYDLVGNNTPVFFVRDASKFQDFIHSQKRLPDTGMRSNDMQWDFWTLSPESAHQVMILMSDRGTPRTYRHINGYGSHTFSWMNAGGEKFWVKYHFKTVQGIETFTQAEADAMSAEDPDFHRRDLRRSIDAGEHPEWRLEVQVMPFEEAADYRIDPFDLTKVWPHGDYPPIEVGRMVLDRNPDNFFAEVEQAGFSPANLVPGIGLSPDKMLMGRIFSYGGPMADPLGASDIGWSVEGAEIGRYANARHAEDDDFGQPRTLYREVMSDMDRDHLVENIVGHASDEVTAPMQERVVAYWASVDPELGERVAGGLGVATRSGRFSRAREMVAEHANRA